MAGEMQAPTSGVLPRGSRRGADVCVCPDLGPRSPAPALGGGTEEAVSGCQLCNPLGSQRLGSGFSGRVFFWNALARGRLLGRIFSRSLGSPPAAGAPHPAGIPGPLYLRGPRRPLPACPLARRPPGSVCGARVPASAPRCYASNAAAARPRASAWSHAEVLDLLSSRGEETAQGLAAGATCPAWRGRVWHRFWHTQAGGSAAACTPAFCPVPSSSVHFHHRPHPCALQPHPPQPPPPRSSPSTPIPLLALCPVAPGVTVPTAPGRL